MEPTAPVTRRRRKRVHSTKCPCCCEDRGKPEKAARTKRREDNDLQPAGSSKLENERSPKNMQDLKINEPKLNEVNIISSELDNGEDNTIKEGRVLRSGRSTPVVAEVELDKGQAKKSNKVVKKKLFTTQKDRKHTTVKNKHKEKSTGNGFKPVSEKHFDTSNAQDTVGGKVKVSKKKNKVESLNQQACPISSKGSLSSNQSGNVSEKNKRKMSSESNKQTRTKRTKTVAVIKPVPKKKTVADERLKIRAFDQLKEKLEIAFSQSPLSVPECVDLLQSITSPNLKEIFESPAAPVVDERAPKEFKSSLSDETTESGSETRILETEIIKKMNESEAAEALVSFKVQTTATNSNSSQCHDQRSLSSRGPSNPNNHAGISSQSLSSFHNVSTFTTSSSVGLAPLSFPNQPFRKLEVPAVTTTSILKPPTLASVPRVQTPVTFQLLQVPNQGTNPTLTGDLTSAHLQQNPGFLYQNSGATMMPNKLAPTPVSQQPNTVFSPAMNQFVYLKLKQHEQKFTGFLPGIQAQDQALSKSSFPSASHPSMCTSVANPTVSMSTPASTSTPDILLSSKLRPILPREPLLAPNFSLFNQSYQQSSGSGTLPNISDKSSDVKEAVKRLFNERTKTSDYTAPELTTALPDIASTFRNSSCTTTSSLDSHERNVLPTFKQEQQDFTEMTSKEQAIKALLSIGGNESLSQRGSVEQDGLGNRPYETNRTNELKVVFDTDKGIFKVDDVTIDPQINTIGKESYTCAKCGKIFTSLSYLARHIKRVCPDMSHRKWKCNHCDKAFRHPFGLQQHVYTHTGERPHKCPQCPKAFYSSNDLRRHSRIHSGERPYKCKHCGKTFATTISLKTHTFIHTGEKPHRCPHCPKTFATSSKLGRHIVTHSEQRPYSCQQCPKTFNRSGDLRRHNLHVHHGKLTENADSGLYEEKIYKCTECTSSFHTPKELEAHIIEHTTEWNG